MLKNKLYVYGEGKVDLSAHMNFGQEIFDSMIENKDIDALINAETNERLTYGELAQQAVDIALSLARLGVGKGDVVSICSEKRFEFMATVLGVICAGATFTPADLTSGTKTLLYRVNIARPKVMFCSATAYKIHSDAFRTVDSIKTYIVFGDEAQPGAVLFKHFLTEHARIEDFRPVPVDGINDILFIRFTSGTTGLPKGIPITHISAIVNFRSYVIDGEEDAKYSRMVLYIWPDVYSGMFELWYYLQSSTARRTESWTSLKLYRSTRFQRIQLAPSTVNEFIKSPIIQNYDVTSVKVIVSTSTTLLGEAVKKFPGLEQVIQLYGISESGMICSDLNVPNGTKPGSVGVACPDITIKVVDLETREPLGPNQRGEICFKSTTPTLISKYLGDHPDPNDEEGFYMTGDVGYYDEDLCFYILDRLKDLIKCNDYSIAPAELESVLEQHPSILEAGVVGAPHESYGEAPLAFVVLRPGATLTEAELVEYVNGQVTHIMKLYGGVRFLDSLPRGAGAKLDRKALKKTLLS